MKKLLHAVNRTPWFIFLSRCCQISGILLAVLLCVHLGRDGTRFITDFTRITLSREWFDRILICAFFAFAGYGILLSLGPTRIRKPCLICLGCGHMAAIFLSFRHDLAAAWIFVASMIIPGFAGAIFERLFGAAATKAWRTAHPEPQKRENPLSSVQLRKAYGSERRKLEKTDYLPIPFLIFVIIYVYVGAEYYVKTHQTAVWHFIGIGLILYLLILYVLSLLDYPIPISLLTSRYLWGNLLVILVLYISRSFRFRTFGQAILSANLTELMYSSSLPDQALAGLIFLFSLVSLILALARKETRKIIGWAVLLYPTAIALTSFLLPLIRFESNGWRMILEDQVALSVCLIAGILSLLMEKLYGGEIRAEWLEAQKRKREKRKDAVRKKEAGTLPVSTGTSGRPGVRSAGTAHPSTVLSGMGKNPVKSVPVSSGPVRPPVRSAPVPQPDRETTLREAKADYEHRREKERNDLKEREENLSVRDLLQKAALRLYPGGEILGTLKGQRQLLVWLTEGIHCLQKIRSSQAGKALMDPSLQDDPAAFLPVLNRVIEEVSARLEQNLWEDDRHWRNRSAEALVGGWFALNMYARMSRAPEIFQLAADGIADYFGKQPDRTDMLKQLCGRAQAEMNNG